MKPTVLILFCLYEVWSVKSPGCCCWFPPPDDWPGGRPEQGGNQENWSCLCLLQRPLSSLLHTISQTIPYRYSLLLPPLVFIYMYNQYLIKESVFTCFSSISSYLPCIYFYYGREIKQKGRSGNLQTPYIKLVKSWPSQVSLFFSPFSLPSPLLYLTFSLGFQHFPVHWTGQP